MVFPLSIVKSQYTLKRSSLHFGSTKKNPLSRYLGVSLFLLVDTYRGLSVALDPPCTPDPTYPIVPSGPPGSLNSPWFRFGYDIVSSSS